MVKDNTGKLSYEDIFNIVLILILAAVAVPNFILYRNKACVKEGFGVAEKIQTALACYVNKIQPPSFPAEVNDWESLVEICNQICAY